MTAAAELLKRETSLVLRFRETLLREQEILNSGTADGLAELNAEKLSLVESLNLAGIERARTLVSNQEGTIDMEAWFSAHPQELESARIWSDMLSAAREARIINELNGKLINALHQRTSDALAFLTQGNTDRTLYGSNGQASLNTGSRIIDSA